MAERTGKVFDSVMTKDYPAIVRGEGIYIFDDQGRRYIDSTGGPLVCSLGHGLEEMADVLHEQVKQITYVHRHNFTTPVLEAAAAKVCEVSNNDLGRAFFVSGGSEAVEIAVKIARSYHLDNSEPSRFKILSRWQSYHGMSMGASAWSGMTERRANYTPMLKDDAHIAPGYCYRCWFNQSPETCQLECAQALENEILCQGPETVAAFIAEPWSGMSLCAATPREDYFRKISQICKKYGVLLILDEVMTGFGRTGKWFAYQHFDITPDILVCGKGMAGGYFPVGAALVRDEIYNKIAETSGGFYAGYTWGANPMAAAVVGKTIDYLRQHNLVERCAEMGEYLGRKLEELRAHPTVGDVRGAGLMWGLEFVQKTPSRQPFDPKLAYSKQIKTQALELGLFLEASAGCDRGQAGDMIMIGPPFNVTSELIDEIVALLDQAISQVEARNSA